MEYVILTLLALALVHFVWGSIVEPSLDEIKMIKSFSTVLIPPNSRELN